MSKKNRKNKDTQNLNEGTIGADDNSIETNQPESSIEAKIAAVFESQIKAEQADPRVESGDVKQVMQEVAADSPQPDDLKDDIQETTEHSNKADSSQDAMDDLLADVRHSLIVDDEAGKSEKKSRWWNRLVKGTSTSEVPDVAIPDGTENDVHVEPVAPVVELEDKGSDESAEEIDELIKLLEADVAEDQEQTADVQVLPPAPVEPEARPDIDELKKLAFSPRPDDKGSEELSDVRQVALGGEEDVFVEVESRAADPVEERIKAVENALRPYRTYLYYALAFIGVIMAIMASVVVFNGVKGLLPTPVATEVVNLPFPTVVTLPGGLNFNLAKGALKNGSWDPRGPEWLEGTEICRWVAIPWSRQLEAAVRTMNREDVIELHMSNNDKLTYKVESIQELTPAQLQEMDSSSPCLAIILAKQDSEKRWVAVGRP